MTDAPKRIWACMEGPMVGLFVSGGTSKWPEYLRADLIDMDVLRRVEAALEPFAADAGILGRRDLVAARDALTALRAMMEKLG